MPNLLHSQLENERARYARLASQERNDAIAKMVLKRMKQEINELEDKLYGEKSRKHANEHVSASGFIRYVFQAMHRFRNYAQSRNRQILSLSTKEALQTKAVVR